MTKNTSSFSTLFATLSLFMVLFYLVTPAYSVSNCGTYRCQIVGVSLKENTTNRTIYSVVTECDYLPFADGACPSHEKRTVVGTAWWDKLLKLAYENIHNKYSEEFLVNTFSKCSQNPWTGPIDCTEIQRNIISVFPLPASPVSARLISATDKTLLAQQEADAPLLVQAPFFLKPKDGSQFEIPATIQIKVRHLAKYEAGFTIQYKKSLSDNSWENLPSPNDWYSTDHRESTDGTMTTSNFNYVRWTADKPGYYRIRTKCRDKNALDSEWLYFTLIGTLSPKIVKPLAGQSFDKQELVAIKATHHPQYNIKFTFQWSPVQEAGEFPVAPVDIFPTLKFCVKIVEGETSCQYYFTKAGLYRVYAQYQEDPLSPVSTQQFKITDKNWKTHNMQPSNRKTKPIIDK